VNSAFQLLRCAPFSYQLANSSELTAPWQLSIQKLFIMLLGNLLPVFSPSEFIDVFRFGGRPIDPTEQQDCFEFLQAILDGFPHSQTLCFRGILSHFYEGTKSSYSSKTDEPFFSLSVSVKGIRSLETSLKLYQQEEGIDDYVNDGERIGVRHFIRFESMPEVLIIHLKRFVYGQGKRQKVGSRFAFPMEWEGGYQLVGCVLHSGAADIGHYCTIVCVGDQWYKFNDSRVKKYTISNLQRDAFGNDAIPTCSCAYILCYSKVPVVPTAITTVDLVRDDLARVTRTLSTNSDAFHDLALKVNDIQFLFLYYFNVLIHLHDGAKCEAIRRQLTDLIAVQETSDVLRMILTDRKHVANVYYNCDVLEILMSWTEFLKSVIKATGNAMKDEIESLLISIKLVRSPATARLIVQLVDTFVSINPENLALAAASKWHVRIHIFLESWYRVYPLLQGYVDWTDVFVTWYKFVPWFDVLFINQLKGLSDYVAQFPGHQTAYIELIDACATLW
jgi:hypothetical protein